MSRSKAVKPEAIEEPMIHRTCNRAQTISSTATPAPEQPRSSGNTTVPDHDVQIGGHDAGALPRANGHTRNSHINNVDDNHNIDVDSRGSVCDQTSSSNATLQTENDDAMHEIGANSRQLIQTIQKLELLEINATVSSLPKFIVVGDQSAGKSSIIEALCNITLPRSHGTCTCSPFQLTTSAASPGTSWKCTVSLFRQYSYDPSVKAGRASRFDNWLYLASPDVVDFTVVSRKEDLELVLRRAQLAILNPLSKSSDFINMVDPEHAARAVKFSPNTVQLKVEAVGLPELSIVDLPGAINVSKNPNEQYLVKFVERLLKFHLDDEKTKILLACSADQDVDTSTAFRFVREAKNKASHRCMGVLTKLDLMHMSKMPQIQRMLAGDEWPLPNGKWFVTKQLSQTELDSNISYGEARIREQRFFSEEPWAGVADNHPAQIGIGNLRTALSRCLTAHIVEELPGIIDRVQGRLLKVDHDLAGLPERPSDAKVTVITEIGDICAVVSGQTKGELNRPFLGKYKATLRDFKEALMSNRPGVDLNTPGYETPPCAVDSEDEVDSPTPKRTPMQARSGATPFPTSTPVTSPNKRKAYEDTPPAYVETPKRVKSKAGKQTAHPPFDFKLDGVRAQNEARSTSGLPGQPCEKVTELLSMAGPERWNALVHNMLTFMKKVALELVLSSRNSVLEARKFTQFFHKSGAVLEDLVDTVISKQADLIQHALSCEQNRPITTDTAALASGTAATARVLRAKRLQIRTEEHFDTMPNDRTNCMNKPAWVEEKLGKDPWDSEIKQLARVLSYYDLAATRFADNVATSMALGLQKRIQDEVKKFMLEQLEPLDDARCSELIAEDPEREAIRVRLQSEKVKLEAAKKELLALPALAARQGKA